MATIVNTPATQADNSSWVGTIVAVLIVGIFLTLFFFYALPLIRSGMNNNSDTTPSTINVNVPDKIDVNTDQNPNP